LGSIFSTTSLSLAVSLDVTMQDMTFLFSLGTGGYTKENKKVIYCIVTSRETAKLKEVVENIDPSAFFIVNDVVEVRGKGFKNIGV
ncbi:MAG: YitT family protein, partial [Tissierellales bacterium]